jgi:DNA-binding transcriptional ArsR family regulator
LNRPPADGVGISGNRYGRGLQSVAAPVIYNPMVVDQAADEAVDRLFRALSDATRRDILRRSLVGEPSVSRLAEAYPMSFAAVQKHVAMLERAGLITKERRGREQLVRTDPDAVLRARQALDQLEAEWRGRVERMSDLLASAPDTEGSNPTTRGGVR